MDNTQVLIDGGSGLPWQNVRVLWEAAAARVLSDCARARLAHQWQAALAEAQAAGRRLFDGPIAQLLNARQDGTQVTLCLSPGSYRDFLVTRVRDRAWFDAHAPEACTLALGNSALLVHGDEALLGIRSAAVSCYAGRGHLIGGVLEALGTADFPADVEGLLAHLRLELREEANVLPADVVPEGPMLLGVFMDEFLGQPEAIWQWETRVPLQAIARQLDGDEHSGCIVLRRGEDAAQTPVPLTPVARRALDAWSRGTG